MAVAQHRTEDGCFRVSAGSDPIALATAISRSLQDAREVSARAVGAGSVNQAAKAVAIARGHVATAGYDLTCRIGFQTIQSRDGEISALIFRLTAE